MLPAMLFRARSALEREAESRIRLVVLVENLVPNFVEEIGRRTGMLTFSLSATTFVAFFHLWLVLLFLYSTPVGVESCRAG